MRPQVTQCKKMVKRKMTTQPTKQQFKRPRPNYQQRFVPRPMSTAIVEKKVNDLDTNIYQVNTTGLFTLLALPQLGSDFNQRIGRKITLKSVYIKGRVQIENAGSLSAAASVSQQCRFIILVDYQPNAAAPAVTDLLVSATPASQLNLNNRDRFRILCDKEYYLDPFLIPAVGSAIYMNRTGQLLKKFKVLNEEMIFNGTNGGTIADITTGALYMFWIGSAAAGVNADANFIGSTRVRYVDA